MRTQVEKKNVLFNFIDCYHEQSGFTKSLSKQDKVYYRYSLPMARLPKFSEAAADYTLLDHHISIYQSQHPDNPYLSQYHYTGYFSDSEEKTWQLHIYYNDFDNLAMHPVFERWNQSEKCTVKLSSLEERQFMIFAQTNLQPVLVKLKSALSNQLASMEKDYQIANNALMKIDVSNPENRVEFLALGQQITTALEGLSKLSTNSLYDKIHQFIKKMDSFINNPGRAVEAVALQDLEPKPTTTTTTILPAMIAAKAQHEDFKKAIYEIETRLHHVKTLSCLKKKSRLIAELLPETWAILLHADEDSVQPGENALLTLQQLQALICHEAENLFPMLIFSNHWDLLDSLRLYHRFIGKKHIELAIKTTNEKLLAFILNHNSQNLINQPLTIGSVIYDSPVQACFELTQSENTKMLSCFSLLIQKDASLLIADKKGVPIAHTLIDSTDHPLKKALFDNPEKTIQSRKLYKNLACLLQMALDNQQFENSEKPAIEKSIAYYQSCKSDYLLSTTLTGLSGKNFSNKMNFFYKENIDVHSLLVKFRSEPDVNQLYKTYEVMFEALLKKLKPQQRLALKKQLPDNLDRFVNHYKDRSPDFSALPFAVLKKDVKDYITAGIEVLSKSDQLFEVQKRIQTPIMKINRNRRRDIQLQNQLIAEIKVLNQRYNFTFDQQSLTVKLQDIEQAMEKIEALMQKYGISIDDDEISEENPSTASSTI